MLLETNRLIIEYFNTNDISDWAEIESDADVGRFVDGKVLCFKEAGEYVELNIRQVSSHMNMVDMDSIKRKQKTYWYVWLSK